MSDNNHQKILELQKQSVDLFGKISFMLITATTASIGYILTQISGSWSNLFFLAILSLIFLGSSFLFGFDSLNKTVVQLNLNSKIIQFYKDKDFKTSQELLNDLEIVLPKIPKSRNLQTYTFILGAVTYAFYVFLKAYFQN